MTSLRQAGFSAMGWLDSVMGSGGVGVGLTCCGAGPACDCGMGLACDCGRMADDGDCGRMADDGERGRWDCPLCWRPFVCPACWLDTLMDGTGSCLPASA